ncbi:MAG: DUF4126 domain-containing protein [Candidatus Hydrogenedentes bacterium]|nr:DUF4126 domain-containing protein [Candidatus Hydrogenedentota bacterium]
METIALIGSVMGVGIVSGINLYATVLTIGLCLRFQLFGIPEGMGDLEVLAHPYVLWTAGILFFVEFFADKIPYVDSLWDAIHTFIRPIAGAILGATMAGFGDPALAAVAFLLAGGVAFTSHATKATTRVAANHSPEPFSNWILSIIEDIVAIVGAVLAFLFPMVALIAVLVFVCIAIWLLPKIVRAFRSQFARVRRIFNRKDVITRA